MRAALSELREELEPFRQAALALHRATQSGQQLYEVLMGGGDLIELVVNESHPVTLGDMTNPFGGLTSELGDKESDGGARAGFPLNFWGRARLVSEGAKEVSVSVGGRRCQVQCYDRLVDNEWSLKVGYSLSPLLHRWTPPYEGMMKQRSELLYRYNDLFELERVEDLDTSPLSPPHSRAYIHFGPPFPDLFRLKIGTAVKGKAAFGVEFFPMPANFTHRCPPRTPCSPSPSRSASPSHDTTAMRMTSSTRTTTA
ncbi:unnamed protein product [Vitrella brassicaformis CCMP3155]|uniref:Uncharacterized protein n=1 Tax=Vitrella brassicaformis (strain CCMP3155) TaxID=1169540 RepID=A0A0G4EJN4_VITBC|nr:unnamed protein product [Vitrella brassicaformis CCMP3155]|eukprot:CEL97640.1 unnamed protein product [Vitrella brassicaformis CCMP3155]